jgi:hypothetical protein
MCYKNARPEALSDDMDQGGAQPKSFHSTIKTHAGPPLPHTPHLRRTHSPPLMQLKSLPKHTPLQSLSPLTYLPVRPPEHTRQSSISAEPKQSPAQSLVELAPPQTPDKRGHREVRGCTRCEGEGKCERGCPQQPTLHRTAASYRTSRKPWWR